MRGLPPPQITVMTFSVHLRNFLAMSGRFIVAVPVSILELYADVFGLTRLPVEVPMAEMPYAIVRLKNRTLSPAAELFMQCLRDVAKSTPAGPDPRSKRPRKRRAAAGR
jgi:DNA-binding transcriptional LysR family regulator